MKRARFIYNPTSGREEIRKRLPDILHRLENGGIETSCHATQGEGDATIAAIEAVKRGFDLIIIGGGDGTVHEVINGVASQQVRPQIGMIPAGTTNDFARALGIPKQWELACDIIIKNQPMPIDVGRINDKYFVNIAGGGSITELTYEVPSKLKTVIGQLAYYMKGIEKLPRLKPFDLKMQTNDFAIEEEAMLFLVSNSNSVGGFEKLAPQAMLDDGLLDVFILKKCSLPEFIRIVTLALRGEHVNDPHVIHFQTDFVQVTSSEKTQLNLDGEYGGTLPCSVSVLPRHLNFLVDRSGLSTYHAKRNE